MKLFELWSYLVIKQDHIIDSDDYFIFILMQSIMFTAVYIASFLNSPFFYCMLVLFALCTDF